VTNLAIQTPTLVVEAENEDEPIHALTTRKFEGDDYIELVIARHSKISWYWQYCMEMECQKVNDKCKGRHDRFWICKSCKKLFCINLARCNNLSICLLSCQVFYHVIHSSCHPSCHSSCHSSCQSSIMSSIMSFIHHVIHLSSPLWCSCCIPLSVLYGVSCMLCHVCCVVWCVLYAVSCMLCRMVCPLCCVHIVQMDKEIFDTETQHIRLVLFFETRKE